jgi:Ca2+-transporting ATPase
LLGAVVVTLLLQLAVIYSAPLNDLFDTQPLSPFELLFTMGMGAVVFFAVEIEKAIQRRRE